MKRADNQLSDISLVITSCGRGDLLARTLMSMTPWLHSIKEKILIDDGDHEQALIPNLANLYGFVYLENERRVGQHRSIDRAYRRVNNAYIFHCEEDWEFNKQPDFTLAKELLYRKDISCVSFRKVDDRRRNKYPDQEFDITRYMTSTHNGKDFLYLPHNSDPAQGSFTFNPNLTKTDLYKAIGPYEQFGTEKGISSCLKSRGYTLGFEPQGSCIHTGWNRHVQDPTKLSRAHSLWKTQAILSETIKHYQRQNASDC